MASIGSVSRTLARPALAQPPTSIERTSHCRSSPTPDAAARSHATLEADERIREAPGSASKSTLLAAKQPAPTAAPESPARLQPRLPVPHEAPAPFAPNQSASL